jgi:hypothetical protein
LADPLALDRAQEQVELLARDIGAARIGRAGIAKGLIAARSRLGRAAADAKRQPAIGEISSAAASSAR